MNDIRCCFPQRAFQSAQAERVPYNACRSPYAAENPVRANLVAVPGELDDIMSAIPKKVCFGRIRRVLPARRGRSVKIVDQKNFQCLDVSKFQAIDGLRSISHFFTKSLERRSSYFFKFHLLKIETGSRKSSAGVLNKMPPTPSHDTLSPAPTAKL